MLRFEVGVCTRAKNYIAVVKCCRFHLKSNMPSGVAAGVIVASYLLLLWLFATLAFCCLLVCRLLLGVAVCHNLFFPVYCLVAVDCLLFFACCCGCLPFAACYLSGPRPPRWRWLHVFGSHPIVPEPMGGAGIRPCARLRSTDGASGGLEGIVMRGVVCADQRKFRSQTSDNMER